MCVVFDFYFIKISKFALPGVMLMYERTSKDRKKENISKCKDRLALWLRSASPTWGPNTSMITELSHLYLYDVNANEGGSDVFNE